MKCALLCPGPSLTRTYTGRQAYACVYAVNRAPLLVDEKVDVWCFADWHVFTDYHPHYMPAILTTKAAVTHLDRKGWHDDLHRHSLTMVEDIDCGPTPKTWRIYTKTAAIMFAFSQGADVLDVYGDDMQGDADADGHTSDKNNRDVTRWDREGQISAMLQAWMWAHGTTVTRHGIS